MAKMHSYSVAQHSLDKYATDYRVSIARCGLTTRMAIKNADYIVRRVDCLRTLLVFVDNHKDTDRLACVVFGLSDNTTLVATVNSAGSFTKLVRYNKRTDKRVSQEWLYSILGFKYYKNDPQREKYHTRVYARNRNCYK